MLVKLGVDISRLERPARRALCVVEECFRDAGCEEPVITSTYEGTHMACSLHYSNKAFDIRLPARGCVEELLGLLRRRLGDDFDLLMEGDHIHIEYDPPEGR